MRESQSAPHSPASSLAPSLAGSDRHFPVGSTPVIANADNIQLPPIPHSNTPLTLTHSRTTSAQFDGAPRRSQSPFPHSLSLPQPSVLDSSGSTQIADVAPNFHGTLEGYHRSAIEIFPLEADSHSVIDIPQSPLSFQQGCLSKFPTAGTEHSILDPSDPESSGLVQGGAHHSRESQPANTLAPSPNKARLLFSSQETLRESNIPTVDESGNWTDGKKRSIGAMHSEQVSRFVSKGAV